MKEEYKFSNLIVGMLTRESLNEAFKKRISAKQIMDFIQSHAHPQCRQSQAFAKQKKLLLDTQKGVADQKADHNDVHLSISSRFALSNEQGIGSVAEQLSIWESEMNCIKEFPGMLISFENIQQHNSFRDFKIRNNIKCLLWSEEWHANRQNVVVVDIIHKSQAYRFINECIH